jgi:hypothetical protein
MKKISLFILSSLFSFAVFAQTTPASTSKKADTKPSAQAAPAAAAGTANTAKPASSSVKKTTKNRHVTNKATPVKEASKPMETKEAPKK